MVKKANNILILGIGNILMGDEGVGVRVAQFINEQHLPENVQCVDGGTGSFQLIEYFEHADIVILIDATVDGNQAGCLNRLEPKYSSDYPRTLTAHDIGLKDLLDAVQILGNPPKIILYTISIVAPDEVTLNLTSKIQNKIHEFADIIIGELNRIL